MGMSGEWLRVTPAELERAKGDLGWLREFSDAMAERDRVQARPVGLRRFLGTGKTFHALDFLLTRYGFPVGLVFGEHDLGDEVDGRRYLAPDQVRTAAAALTDVTHDGLVDGVDQAELSAAGIYPAVWDRPDELWWAVSSLADTKVYFAAAARSGDAVICWAV
ncbi:YfbM family protein [Dactylosporangium sp. CA-233914]|uniref:YfbM family protein n=1 Tax=Dactylosporangium sp. CA-233914 TaxID=3239934 RepID=UPI003D91AAF0